MRKLKNIIENKMKTTTVLMFSLVTVVGCNQTERKSRKVNLSCERMEYRGYWDRQVYYKCRHGHNIITISKRPRRSW